MGRAYHAAFGQTTARLLKLLKIALVAALGTQARAADGWSAVGALDGRVRVDVDLRDGSRARGFVERVDADRLVLRPAKTIDRAAVVRVSRKSRGRGALIGLLVGFGAGFATGAAAGPYVTDFGNPGAGRRVKYGLGWGMFGGGIGAGVGALTGARVTLHRP